MDRRHAVGRLGLGICALLLAPGATLALPRLRPFGPGEAERAIGEILAWIGNAELDELDERSRGGICYLAFRFCAYGIDLDRMVVDPEMDPARIYTTLLRPNAEILRARETAMDEAEQEVADARFRQLCDVDAEGDGSCRHVRCWRRAAVPPLAPR